VCVLCYFDLCYCPSHVVTNDDDDDVCGGRYGSGTLTSVFIDRVFQECLTYDGEMDYKTYLDFVLAIENRKEPPSLQYMFRLLDVQNKGCLNIFDLNYFFRVIILLFIIIVLKYMSRARFLKLGVTHG